jgi:hypothetical protein
MVFMGNKRPEVGIANFVGGQVTANPQTFF